jgi:hypothetical protein
VNYTPTGKSPLAGLRQGGKTVKKRHRVVRRAGAVVEADCGISANPSCRQGRGCGRCFDRDTSNPVRPNFLYSIALSNPVSNR